MNEMKFKISKKNNLIMEHNNHSICKIMKIFRIIILEMFGQHPNASNPSHKIMKVKDGLHALFIKYDHEYKNNSTIQILNIADKSQHQHFLDELDSLLVEWKLTL